MGYARVYWAVCFDGQLGSFIYNHFVKTKLEGTFGKRSRCYLCYFLCNYHSDCRMTFWRRRLAFYILWMLFFFELTVIESKSPDWLW